MNPSPRIVVFAPDLNIANPEDEQATAQAERSRSLRIGLLENGFNLVANLPADVFLTERIAQLQPDLIIVDAESDARDALDHVVMATRDERRPIVMFTNDGDTRDVKNAGATGVSAYIVADLQPERIRPILDAALARFAHEQALLQTLATTQNKLIELYAELKDRKLIDRAKGLLMQRQGLERRRGLQEDDQDSHGQRLETGRCGAAHARCGGFVGLVWCTAQNWCPTQFCHEI